MMQEYGRRVAGSNIATTESYYVTLNADDLSQELWKDFGPKSGKIIPTPVSANSESTEPSYDQN